MANTFDPQEFVKNARGTGKKVSITMVCFNRWNLTSQSLASILLNTHLPYILTVVDNNSWDGTKERLRELRRSNKIDRLILLPENKGIAVGKNFGLRASEGETDWYCCVDNDIRVSPHWLSYLCYISALPGLGVIGCNVQGFGLPGRFPGYTLTEWKTVEGLALDDCPNPGGIYVFSTPTFEKLGYFAERSLYGLEDSELHSRQKHHGLRSVYVRDVACRELPDEKFLMEDGETTYRDFKTDTHRAILAEQKELFGRGELEMLERYETQITLEDVKTYTWEP